MHYVRRKGLGTDGSEAVKTFRREWKEAVGDSGEQVGDVSRDYGVEPGDATATAEPIAAEVHEALTKAGYTRIRQSERGTHYAMGAHKVVVSKESVGGFQAEIRSATGRVTFVESVDDLNANLPRQHRTRESSEAIGRFWGRYLRG